MKLSIRILLLVLPLLMLTVNSCKKDDDQTQPATITADKLVVNQLEVATLTAENMALNSQEYTGTFNGAEITIAVHQDRLAFVVPEVAAGTYTLQATIEGKALSIAYTVNALPTISDPDAYLQTHLTSLLLTTSVIDTIVAATANMYDPQNNAANAQIVKNYTNNLNSQLAQATPSEKAELAKFVAANPDYFHAMEDVSAYVDSFNVARMSVLSSGNTPEERLADIKTEINTRVNKLIAMAATFAAVNAYTFSIPGVNIIVGVVTTGILLHEIWLLQNYLIINLDKSLIEFANPAIINVDGRLQQNLLVDFYPGHPYSVWIKADYRNMNNQDQASTKPSMVSIITRLNDYQEAWEWAQGILPDPLLGNSFHTNNVTAQKVKNMYINVDYIEVEIIGNNNVDVVVSGDNEPVVTFTTTQTADQNFTVRFWYVYEGVDVNHVDYDGILHVNEDCSTSTLNVTANRVGKTVTASATGGTAPYQYKFANNYKSQDFSDVNTFDLMYDGRYYVIVRDAIGCTDTIMDCVSDVSITEFTSFPSDSINTTPSGVLKISYTSSLGLIPEFMRLLNGDYKIMDYIVTSSNSTHYTSNLADLCDGGGFGGFVLASDYIEGNDNNRTVYYVLMNDDNPLGGTNINVKLLQNCGGTNPCQNPSPYNRLYSQERTIHW